MLSPQQISHLHSLIPGVNMQPLFAKNAAFSLTFIISFGWPGGSK